MKRIGFVKIACVIAAFCVATAVASFAQTFTSLASFDKTDGEAPWYSSVVQGADGNLYGMTPFGGSSVSSFCSGCGTVYKITPSGELTTIYSFCSQNNCTDGWEPFHGLTLGTDGNFYGTTQKGGANCIVSIGGCGTIFKVTPGGSLTTLYNFCEQAQCTDGSTPQAGLVQGTDGNFYGTTWEGGAGGVGTVFKITPAGQFTTLHSFCLQAGCVDGSQPVAGLVQGNDGYLYGTTSSGGRHTRGTIFRVNSSAFTTLYAFCPQPGCSDGADPTAPLIQASNGNFYGTAQVGGITTSCGPYGCGTIFQLTATGEFSVL